MENKRYVEQCNKDRDTQDVFSNGNETKSKSQEISSSITITIRNGVLFKIDSKELYFVPCAAGIVVHFRNALPAEQPLNLL